MHTKSTDHHSPGAPYSVNGMRIAFSYDPARNLAERGYHRDVHATALRLAAAVEDATPRAERWVVIIDDAWKGVALELYEDSDEERARAERVLRGVAQILNGAADEVRTMPRAAGPTPARDLLANHGIRGRR